MKRIRQLLPVLVIALGLLIAYVIYLNKPEARRRPSHRKPVTVETIKLKAQDYPVTIHTQGVVEPRTMTTLIPRVSGEIIKTADNFRPGGFFEAGDTLLVIDPTDYRLAIKSAQATLSEAMLSLKEEQALAEQAAENWKQLGRREPPSDLVLRKPQLARAKAAVDSALAQLERVKLDLNRTRIKAPFAGRILEQFVDIGQYVSPGNPLAKIFAVDYVEVRLPVTEQQRSLIDLPYSYRDRDNNNYTLPAATVFATIGGKDFSWKGNVVRTEGSVDRQTRQIYIVVQIDNPYHHQSDHRPPLEIGQFVKAEIEGKVINNVYPVPRSAVQGNNTIMVVDKHNRIHRRTLDVVWETDNFLLARNALKPEEQLCATYIPFVAENAEVVIASDGNKSPTYPYKHGKARN
jgi:RND family efflux transporter MFP subunit